MSIATLQNNPCIISARSHQTNSRRRSWPRAVRARKGLYAEPSCSSLERKATRTVKVPGQWYALHTRVTENPSFVRLRRPKLHLLWLSNSPCPFARSAEMSRELPAFEGQRYSHPWLALVCLKICRQAGHGRIQRGEGARRGQIIAAG